MNRHVRFRSGGLNAHVSVEDWPEHLPLPPSGSTVIEMPNGQFHKGIIEDKVGAYHQLVPKSDGGYAWASADDVHESSLVGSYR